MELWEIRARTMMITIIRHTFRCVSRKRQSDMRCVLFISIRGWQLLPNIQTMNHWNLPASDCGTVWQMKKCMSPAESAAHRKARHFLIHFICRTTACITRAVRQSGWHFLLEECWKCPRKISMRTQWSVRYIIQFWAGWRWTEKVSFMWIRWRLIRRESVTMRS